MTNDNYARVECEFVGRTLTLETGQIARQAHGSVLVTLGETQCFAAACTEPGREDLDFFPLTVDYREKTDSAGKIPGGFFKREGRPTTKEILTMRMIDFRDTSRYFAGSAFSRASAASTVYPDGIAA